MTLHVTCGGGGQLNRPRLASCRQPPVQRLSESSNPDPSHPLLPYLFICDRPGVESRKTSDPPGSSKDNADVPFIPMGITFIKRTTSLRDPSNNSVQSFRDSERPRHSIPSCEPERPESERGNPSDNNTFTLLDPPF